MLYRIRAASSIIYTEVRLQRNRAITIYNIIYLYAYYYIILFQVFTPLSEKYIIAVAVIKHVR